VSPSLIDRDDDSARTKPDSLKTAQKLAAYWTETSFAVRPRTRLSFAYFSLEDKEK
jgi:hypothetical protein